MAVASADCAIKAVHFQSEAGEVNSAKCFTEHARVRLFGGWSTIDVPNGLYTVQSTVRDVRDHACTAGLCSSTFGTESFLIGGSGAGRIEMRSRDIRERSPPTRFGIYAKLAVRHGERVRPCDTAPQYPSAGLVLVGERLRGQPS